MSLPINTINRVAGRLFMRLWLALSLGLAGLSAGCQSYSPGATLAASSAASAASEASAPAATSAPAVAPPRQLAYRLQPGDTFDIKFYLTPELNENVIIRPDGLISLQLVGAQQAAGLTVAELEEALRTAYVKELRNPEIAVIVKSYSPQRVFVAGEVKAPGEVPMQGPMTALQAIARAGFFTPDAQLNNVVVLRYNGSNGPEFITLNANAMLAQPASPEAPPLHATHDVVLQPMDLVFVAQTRIAGVADFFNRYVNNILPLWRNLGFSMVYYTNTAKVVNTGDPVVTP